MEAKKDLNNTQRKMLDQIYSEEFEKKAQAILSKRARNFEALKVKVLGKETISPAIKKLIATGKDYFQQLEACKAEMHEKGLNLSQTIREVPTLSIRDYSYGSDTIHPELQAFKDETEVISMQIAEKKKEMRASIYGMATSYAEVSKEVTKILNGVGA
jgi:hypothetical protein